MFLNKVHPANLEVNLDALISKELPVQVDWAGKLPDHLNLVKVSLAPESVSVVGGRQVLQALSTIYTAPVRLDNLPKSGTTTTSLVLTPPSLKLVSSASEKVTITYVLEEKANQGRK